MSLKSREGNMTAMSPDRGGPRISLGMLIPFSNAGLKPLTSALLADASDVAANFEPFRVREIAPWHQQDDRLHIQFIERVIGIPVCGIVSTGGVWKGMRLAGADPSRIRRWGRQFRDVV